MRGAIHYLTLFILCFFHVMVATAQRAIIYAAILSNKQYVVGASNAPVGVVVSADSGKTWERLCWPNCRAFDVAVESSGRICYVAGGNGVLKTVNWGETWRIATGWEVTEVQDIQINQNEKSWVTIGTASGLFISEDSGQTWIERNGFGIPFCSALCIDRCSDQRLWVGTENGLFVSENRGEVWHSTTVNSFAVRTIVQHPVNDKILFAGTEDHGVYASGDGGKSWFESNRGMRSQTVYTLALDPVHTHTLYAGTHGRGVYISRDGGRHWKRSVRGLKNLVIHAIASLPDASVLLAGTVNGGVYTSRDRGKTWQFAGLDGAQVWDIEVITIEGYEK
jgi:photosystem II stability/assembly factor-like uncharacterized protein